MIEKDNDVYVTWLPREKCEEHSNQYQKFELGMIPFIQCVICETQFFDFDEAKNHSTNIHPIAVANENHKSYSISTMKGWTLTTYTCNKCGYENRVKNHRCGNCNRVFTKQKEIKT